MFEENKLIINSFMRQHTILLKRYCLVKSAIKTTKITSTNNLRVFKHLKKAPLFILNFKITQSNVFVTITKKNKLLFGTTVKRVHLPRKVRAYTWKAISELCAHCVDFFQLKFRYLKKKNLNFNFVGLIKFRLSIIKFFLRKKFYIGWVRDLNFPAHNGVRACKKRRLAKKKRRKIYWFAEVKKKKKLLSCVIIFKSFDLFYIYNFFLKFSRFQLFKVNAIFLTKKQLHKLAVIRSVHNFSASKDHFLCTLYSIRFKISIANSPLLGQFFKVWLKNLNFLQYSGSNRIVFTAVSYKF